jgi:hypothetical protein
LFAKVSLSIFAEEMNRDMSEEKKSILEYFLLFPMDRMGKSVERNHDEMDEIRPGDAFLKEDKRAIGVAGAVSGCLMTLIWIGIIFVLLVVALILLIVWLI